MKRLRIVAGKSLGTWVWENVECNVCLTEIDDPESGEKCPNCDARFHHDCYRGLLNTKPYCPKCRGELAK